MKVDIRNTCTTMPEQWIKTWRDLSNPCIYCSFLIQYLLGTPNNFRVVAYERNVTFSWSVPSVSTPITGYRLSCSPPPSSSSLPHSFTASGTYNLTGFYPDTSYNCSVVAYNMGSTGPPAIVSFTTKEDCELISFFQF